jgi:hypothetical protein
MSAEDTPIIEGDIDVAIHADDNAPTFDADGDGVMSLEEWSKAVFQNHVLKSYAGVMQAAVEMKCTIVRYLMAFGVLGGAIFNVYAIMSNFYTVINDRNSTTNTGKLVSLGNAKIFVFSFEFAIVLCMVGYLIYYMTKSLVCKTHDESSEGETSLTIVRQVQNIGLFSLVKGAAGLKSFVGEQFADWKVFNQNPEMTGNQKKGHFCFWFVIKLGWVMLSVVAFLLKLTQVSFVTQKDPDQWTQTDYVAFFGFVNNMISLYSPPRIALNAVFTFVFAGHDSSYTAAERKLQTEFMECLAYKLTNGNSFIAGHAILLTLSVADVQSLLLKDVGVVEFVGEVDDDL